MSHNLMQWTVADVASYFSAAGFPEQAMAFRTQVSAPPQNCHRGHYMYTDNHTYPVHFERQLILSVLHSPVISITLFVHTKLCGKGYHRCKVAVFKNMILRFQ